MLQAKSDGKMPLFQYFGSISEKLP